MRADEPGRKCPVRRLMAIRRPARRDHDPATDGDASSRVRKRRFQTCTRRRRACAVHHRHRVVGPRRRAQPRRCHRLRRQLRLRLRGSGRRHHRTTSDHRSRAISEVGGLVTGVALAATRIAPTVSDRVTVLCTRTHDAIGTIVGPAAVVRGRRARTEIAIADYFGTITRTAAA